jgi:transposase
MDHKEQEQIALYRWAVIAEAANDRLTAAERGALVRQIAARDWTHPDGSARTYSRGTIDRWIRAWRAGGLDALRPSPRADTGTVRAHPQLFAEAAALRLELPGRSAAQIASILYHRHGVRVAERTVRAQLRRAGLQREALTAEPKAYGRYEAARPNERWISDVLVGPWVPWPRRDGSVRARLFLTAAAGAHPPSAATAPASPATTSGTRTEPSGLAADRPGAKRPGQRGYVQAGRGSFNRCCRWPSGPFTGSLINDRRVPGAPRAAAGLRRSSEHSGPVPGLTLVSPCARGWIS